MEYKWLLQENIELYMEPRSSNDYSKAFSFQFLNNSYWLTLLLFSSIFLMVKGSNFGELQEWIIYLKFGPTLLKCGQVDQSAVICYDNDVDQIAETLQLRWW